MTGIIIALKSEYQVNEKKYKHQNVNGFDIYADNKIVFIYSGVGKANAAAATILLIEKFKTKKIINIGSVGTISKKINVFDIVICQKIQYFDVDVTKFGYRPNQMAREKEFFESTIVLNQIKTTKATLYTGETFVDKAYWKKLKIQDSVGVVDMEGCAIAQMCDKAQIQYALLKVVSDSIHNPETNSKQWDENIKKVNDIIKNIISKIENF